MRLASSTVLLALTLAASPAAADEPSPALTWGVTAGELATAGVFAANFNNVWPSHGPALILNFTPMLLGPAAAYGAHVGELDPRPALAVHGAGWLGLDMFMLGALIDGRDTSFGLRSGKVAWTLGALGALAGGVVGATAIDDEIRTTAWLAAPPAGFALGGLLLGGALVLIGGIDGDAAPGQFATGAVAGGTIGLGAALYFAYRGDGSASSMRLAPAVSSGHTQTLFSLGGAF